MNRPPGTKDPRTLKDREAAKNQRHRIRLLSVAVGTLSALWCVRGIIIFPDRWPPSYDDFPPAPSPDAPLNIILPGLVTFFSLCAAYNKDVDPFRVEVGSSLPEFWGALMGATVGLALAGTSFALIPSFGTPWNVPVPWSLPHPKSGGPLTGFVMGGGFGTLWGLFRVQDTMRR